MARADEAARHCIEMHLGAANRPPPNVSISSSLPHRPGPARPETRAGLQKVLVPVRQPVRAGANPDRDGPALVPVEGDPAGELRRGGVQGRQYAGRLEDAFRPQDPEELRWTHDLDPFDLAKLK